MILAWTRRSFLVSPLQGENQRPGAWLQKTGIKLNVLSAYYLMPPAFHEL